VTGIRYARHNRHLQATMMCAVGFFLVGSAYWALLPLVARQQIAGGPELYGILLGAIGTGAVVGAFGLSWLKNALGPDRLAWISRSERPRRRAAKQRNELTPLHHSITSSASDSKLSENLTPSTFAVLRLITNNRTWSAVTPAGRRAGRP
jgi:hypothetical protein